MRSCLALLSLPTLAGTDRRVINSKSEVDSLSWRLEEKFKKSSTLKFSKTTEQLVNWNKLAELVSCNTMYLRLQIYLKLMQNLLCFRTFNKLISENMLLLFYLCQKLLQKFQITRF
jgi:hypothetical protein